MKVWLKKFLKGTYIAYCMIITVGIVFIVLWLLITAAMIGSVWFGSVVAPTTNNIVIVICVFFVVAFGLIWSAW